MALECSASQWILMEVIPEIRDQTYFLDEPYLIWLQFHYPHYRRMVLKVEDNHTATLNIVDYLLEICVYLIFNKNDTKNHQISHE